MFINVLKIFYTKYFKSCTIKIFAKFWELNILNFKKTGSVAKIIVKGEKEDCEKILKDKNPLILDFLPLTLEEIFIYEMEVLGYEFNQVV